MMQLRQVTKTYRTESGRIAALKQVDLHIRAGEFLAVTGSSGSGKTTLMNVLGCLDRPSSGIYLLGGKAVCWAATEQLARLRNRHIGFIFQNFQLIPRLTAIENVELPLLIAGKPFKERGEQALQALRQVGLESRIRHKPSELSGGQQQRVAIARAIAMDPPILLADEPTGNLDPEASHSIIGLLKQLSAQGRTIVLITHDLALSRQASRVISLVDGAVIEQAGSGEAAAITDNKAIH